MSYDDDRTDYDYAAMATGHMRETGGWPEWEDWFTERGMGVLGRPQNVRGIYDRLKDRFLLSELDQIWNYVKGSKLKDPKGFFMKAMELQADDIEETLRKVKRHLELQKLRGHNMDRDSAERTLQIRNEFICAHIQERRTVDWMIAKEKLTRSDVIEVWDRLRPGMDTPGIKRDGPEEWEDVLDAPASWRRDDEADVLREERRVLFDAASKRKAERRAALGRPIEEPEDLTPGDFELLPGGAS